MQSASSRGTASSGYMQRNLAQIKTQPPSTQSNDPDQQNEHSASRQQKKRLVHPAIAKHESRRAVEVECCELEEKLWLQFHRTNDQSVQRLSDVKNEIKEKVSNLRSSLL